MCFFVHTTPFKKDITVTDQADNMLIRRAELEVLRTIPELLTHHLEHRPQIPIYKFYDNRTKQWQTLTVQETYERVQRWAHAFAALGLKRGDRVAMLLPNGIDAICFDLAALTCALVPVPLHAIDTPGSSAFILRDSGARFLVTTKLNRWRDIGAAMDLPDLNTVVITDEGFETETHENRIVTSIDHWLSTGEGSELPPGPEPTDLAGLVYTSGTTGKPKGVMLTHRNILSNINGVLNSICPDINEVWLSFLPLSHTFERLASYYLALGFGNLVAFNRNIGLLQDDLRVIRPTIMMSVPRVYEKIKPCLKTDAVVRLAGKIDIPSEKLPSIILDTLTAFVPPDEAPEETPAAQPALPQVLWLDARALSDEDFSELIETISAYGGDVRTKILHGGKRYEYAVKLSRALTAELKTFLPSACIKLV